MKQSWVTSLHGTKAPTPPTVGTDMTSTDINSSNIAPLPPTTRRALFDAVLRSDLYSFVQAAFPIVAGFVSRLRIADMMRLRASRAIAAIALARTNDHWAPKAIRNMVP
jgi:hypothetical protein